MIQSNNGLKKNRDIFIAIYVLSNFYFVFAYYFDGTLGGDLSGRYVSYFPSLLSAFFLILISWLFFFRLFSFFERIKVITVRENSSKSIDYIMFFLGSVHFYGLLMGYISPSSDTERSSFYLLFNYIFSVDLLLLIYLFYNISKRSFFYYLNITLTIAIYLYSGRTSILIFGLALINLFFYTKRGKINFSLNFLLIGLAFLISPFIRSLKHYALLTVISDKYRQLSFFDGFVFFWNESSFFSKYLKYFNESMERFEHVSNVAFVIDNTVSINQYLSNFSFSLVYPPTKRIIENILSIPNVHYQLNKLMGSYISKGETYDWNVPVGVVGLFFINDVSIIFYFFISIILIFISIFLSKMISVRGFLLELSFLTMFLFILHGWINDFLSYVSSLLVFLILLLCMQYFERYLKYNRS